MGIELVGTVLFLASVVGGLGALTLLGYAVVRRRRRLARSVLLASLLWVVVYGALLIGTSLVTPQQILAEGQERCFDEMCFSITQAVTQPTLGTGTQPRGTFYVVTMQLRNASRRVAQKPDHPTFFLDDAQGKHYLPSPSGQQAFGQQPTWETRLQPGETQARLLVFDAPASLQLQTPQPRLGITEGSWPTPLIIGDENSPWHQQTVIRLTVHPTATHRERLKADYLQPRCLRAAGRLSQFAHSVVIITQPSVRLASRDS
jgi:hypothetical protein